jgi:hypothetical protein
MSEINLPDIEVGSALIYITNKETGKQIGDFVFMKNLPANELKEMTIHFIYGKKNEEAENITDKDNS